jgi:CBS domain-containing protein
VREVAPGRLPTAPEATVKARNLVSPYPTVRADAPAPEAAALLARQDVRAVLVVGSGGELVGILSDTDLLEWLLPTYVEEDAALARVLDEAAADASWRSIQGRTAGELLPEPPEEEPVVEAEATLVEVADVMRRAGVPVVAVREDGRLIGAITIDDLLPHLLGAR